jgi:ribosomal protein S18 acetylase RimI-like enzyme
VFGGAEEMARYRDQDLLGHFYAAPYAILEPELCFVLTLNGAPVGYVLGTADSAGFREACEAQWFPPLREHYPLPDASDRSRDAAMIRLIHRGHSADLEFPDYPAHLHIDLLPIAQGSGHGRKLMTRFLETLRVTGLPGVHLGVGRVNMSAIGFYERMGFQQLEETEFAIIFGMRF